MDIFLNMVLTKILNYWAGLQNEGLREAVMEYGAPALQEEYGRQEVAPVQGRQED